jgi:hypothetical protein
MNLTTPVLAPIATHWLCVCVCVCVCVQVADDQKKGLNDLLPAQKEDVIRVSKMLPRLEVSAPPWTLTHTPRVLCPSCMALVWKSIRRGTSQATRAQKHACRTIPEPPLGSTTALPSHESTSCLLF